MLHESLAKCQVSVLEPQSYKLNYEGFASTLTHAGHFIF